jgi:hypothetical protein
MLARRSAAWIGALCAEEAEQDAGAAIERGVVTDPTGHALALGALAMVAAARRDEENAVRLHGHAMRVIWRAGLIESDLHVIALIRESDSLYTFGHFKSSTLKLEAAESSWRRARYEHNDLRRARGLFLQYKRAEREFAHSEPEGIARLLHLIAAAEAAGRREFGALGHMSLAELYRKTDLYSPSLVHSAIASEMWGACGRQSRVAEVALIRSNTLSSLGLMLDARRILDDIEGAGVGSRGRYVEAERLIQLADLARYEGDANGAVDLALAGARLTPHIVLGDFTAAIGNWFTAALHAHATGRVDALAEASSGLLLAAGQVRESGPWPDVTRMIASAATGDIAGATSLASLAREKWPEWQSITGARVEDLVGLVERFVAKRNAPEELALDLAEFWEHIVHVSAEDDEQIRAQFRLANCLPVLHRILTGNESALSPDLQFELVELVRFGAIPALHATSRERPEAALRVIAREHLKSAGMHFPAVHGEPRPLRFAGVSTELAAIVDAPLLDVDVLLRLEDGDLPDVLQLYLRGSTLHWVYRVEGHVPLNGCTTLDRGTLGTLAAFRSLATPHIGPFEGQVAGAHDVAAQFLRIVAAARTAYGSLARRPEIAADLLRFVPAHVRNRVWRELAELEGPDDTEIAYALGNLIPACVWAEKTKRRLVVSTDLQLAVLPLVLADRPEWTEPLLARRYPVVMPPLNLLAASPPPIQRAAADPWAVTRVGNTLGDLSFAGPRSAEEAVLSAFVISDATEAARRAVLYRGHLVEPPAGRPSEAGIYTAADQGIRARTMLEDPRPWRTPARLALMACRAAGWDMGGEWGGLAAAAMLRGTQSVIAPLWPLIDAEPAAILDSRVCQVIGEGGDLAQNLGELTAELQSEWSAASPGAIPPHWWASLVLVSR